MKRERLLNIMMDKYPNEYAEDWDNTGFMIDCGKTKYERILTALELTPEVMREAIETRSELVITHHPLIFKPIKNFDASLAEDRLVMDCIKNDISVFSIHTNCDNHEGGTNDYLSDLIGLEGTQALNPLKGAYCKLIVFVPSEHVSAVTEKMGEMGGGSIGSYSDCTFSSKGIGSFRPLDGANPHIGEIGKLEKVDEMRVETILPFEKVKSTVEELKSVHPYEEMAYDIIHLENIRKNSGGGRVGMLSKPRKFKMLLAMLKDLLSAEVLKYTGDEERIIEKVGLCTGSGSDFIRDAYKSGVECFLTGDIKYHDAQFARMNNLALVDIGHYESEDFFKHLIKKMLSEEIASTGSKCEIHVSDADINPFKYYK
ncbi:MAG: Nif3-like dinuclear metal center hexameric protein [Clostridiales bacterium]|nr:MAG: Nif3-like dinuclear metal center hexameric protein [Clostridiales bacterium]